MSVLGVTMTNMVDNVLISSASLLLALKTVKQRICKQIQMHLFTVELDTQQITSKEMAAQLLHTFRLYVPTQMIPKGL